MIMIIFLLFLGLGFVLTLTGYYVKENLLIIFGFLIFGLISFPLISEELQYKNGANITGTFTYNGTAIDSSLNVIVYDYEEYTDTLWYGLFLLFTSLSGMFMWYQGYRGGKDEDD